MPDTNPAQPPPDLFRRLIGEDGGEQRTATEPPEAAPPRPGRIPAGPRRARLRRRYGLDTADRPDLPPGWLMPLVRPCRNRWCPEAADQTGWCDRHRKAPFWSSPPLPPDWAQIRAEQLRAYPQCHECGGVAVEVHHIRGREAGHAPGNLRSLCSGCHKHVTAVEAGWLSAP